jgi:thiamine-monophosphate kinase
VSGGERGHTPLGPGGEFDRIRAIWRRLGEQMSQAGEDCALVTIGNERLAISTDVTIEGTHFRKGWLAPEEVGWRAAAAALSDLAAVAAEPRGVMASLGVSPEWPEELVSEVMHGVGQAAAAVDAQLWGGDLVRSERLVLDVVVVGRAEAPVLRSGAAPGEGLWVTGALGGPAAALAAWLAGGEPEQTARERFAHPRPRIAEALWLRDEGATAMIDLSDGLIGDAGHLAAASGVRCVIEDERVPVHPAASPRGALVGGEEYELLAALPRETDNELAAAFEDTFGIRLTRVGRVEEGQGVELLENGAPAALPGGFTQF